MGNTSKVILCSLLAACGRSEPEALELPRPAEPPSPAPVAPDGGVACTTQLDVRIAAIPDADPSVVAWPDRGGVVFQAPEGIVRLRVSDGARELVAGPGHALVEAREGIVVASRRGERVVFSAGRSAVFGVIGSRLELSVRRSIADGRVAACTSDFSIASLDPLRDERFETLSQGGPCREPLFASERHVVYARTTERRGSEVVYWHVSGELPETIGRGESPVVLGDRALFLREGAIFSADLRRGGEPRAIDPGPCIDLSAGPAGALFLCEPAGPIGLPAVGRSLRFYDGERLHTLEPGAALAASPRVGRGFVAWLAYDDPELLCRGGSDAGSVMIDRFDGRGPRPIARVAAGCLCCDAFWPPPFLEVDGDTLSFNYDASAGEPAPDRGGGVAAARLGEVCR